MTPETIVSPIGDNPPKASLYYGQDVRESLRLLPDKSVQMIATSPPYWGLRDYGVDIQVWGGDSTCDHEWGDIIRSPWANAVPGPTDNIPKNPTGGGAHWRPKESGCICQKCGAWKGCLGLEPSHHLYVEHIVEVFRELKRVLRDDGVAWLNLGDSYNSAGRETHGTRIGMKQGTNRASATGADSHRATAPGLKQKDLVGIPWRVAFALRADGWYLRSDVIWHKPNPMPEAVTDRPTRCHEYIFLLTKNNCYYFDTEAVREYSAGGVERPQLAKAMDILKNELTEEHLEAIRACGIVNVGGKVQSLHGRDENSRYKQLAAEAKAKLGAYYRELTVVAGRNRRTVWTITTKQYPGSHFAVWPPDLVELMIKAGTSEKGCCPTCGAPIHRVTERVGAPSTQAARQELAEENFDHGLGDGPTKQTQMNAWQYGQALKTSAGAYRQTLGWEPTCKCDPLPPIRCVTLDPFSGSGTTGKVAMDLGRDYIGIDLNGEYLPMARARLTAMDAPVDDGQVEEDGVLDLFGGDE